MRLRKLSLLNRGSYDLNSNYLVLLNEVVLGTRASYHKK